MIYFNFKKKIILTLLFLIVFSLSSETIYYESTKYGMPIREIGAGRSEEFDYVLIYQKNGSREVKRLLNGEDEIKKWEREVKRKNCFSETEYDHGEIVSRHFIENGLQKKEEIYFEGELSEVRDYFYSQRELIKTEFRDGTNKLLFTNHYLTTSQGRLTRVIENIPNKPENIYSYQYSDNELTQMTAKGKDKIIYYKYKGTLLASVKEKVGKKVIYYREEPLPGVRQTVEQDFLLNLKIISDYSKKGTLIKRTTWVGEDKEVRRFIYNNKELLVEEKIRSKGVNKKNYFLYDNKDSIQKKETYTDGILVKKTIYSTPSDYIETIYREEKPLFELEYIDNVKVSTRFIISPILDDKLKKIDDKLLSDSDKVNDRSDINRKKTIQKNTVKEE